MTGAHRTYPLNKSHYYSKKKTKSSSIKTASNNNENSFMTPVA